MRWRHVNLVQPNAEKHDQPPRLTIVTFFPNLHMDLLRRGGFSGQSFVKDCAGLLLALENPRPVDMPKDYFFLDENLKSWDEILRL